MQTLEQELQVLSANSKSSKKGNKSAGTRARKVLQDIKAHLSKSAYISRAPKGSGREDENRTGNAGSLNFNEPPLDGSRPG